MDITIYLPDDIAERAKREQVNLSRMLRDALVQQFAEEDAMTDTLKDATVHKLNLEDDDGRGYTGRITGTRIAEGSNVVVFLTDQENVVVYDVNKLRHQIVQDPAGELRDWLDDGQYVEAMHALGQEVEVDLDV